MNHKAEIIKLWRNKQGPFNMKSDRAANIATLPKCPNSGQRGVWFSTLGELILSYNRHYKTNVLLKNVEKLITLI